MWRNRKKEEEGPAPRIFISLSSFRRRGLLRALARCAAAAVLRQQAPPPPLGVLLYGQPLKSSVRFKNSSTVKNAGSSTKRGSSVASTSRQVDWTKQDKVWLLRCVHLCAVVRE